MQDQSSEAQIERLVTACLERIPAEGAGVVQKICDENPELLDEVCASLEALRAGGFDVDRPPVSRDRVGTYRLLSPLGTGAMGVVHRALCENTGEEVALKIIRPEYRFFAGAQQRFQLEMAAAARLSHPSIVSLREVGEADGVSFLAMECVDGRTLATILQLASERSIASLSGSDMHRMLGGLPSTDVPALFRGTWAETCLRIARDIARALQHAHDQAVLHRDVKPSNIMVTNRGRVLLMDFGLARAEDRSRVTRTGALLGSHAYMSPEQMREAGTIDGRADTYALGVSLHEMLTLRLPYDCSDSEALRRLILSGQPESMKHALPGIRQDVETVCLSAMDVDPRRRYATPDLFAEDIERLLAGLPIRARPPGAFLRARRQASRHPVAALAVTFATLLIVGAVSFGLEQSALRRQATRSSESFRRLSRSILTLTDIQALSADAETLSTLGELCDELLASPDEDPGQRLAVLAVTGDVYRLHGDYGRSQGLLEEAVALGRSLGVSGSLALSDSLTKLGQLHVDQGNPSAARSALLEALEIRRSELGEVHSAVSAVLQKLAVAEAMLFEHASVRRRLAAALDIHRALPGDDRDVARTLNTLAQLELRLGNADDAQAVLDQAEAIERASLRSTDLVTLQTRDLRAKIAVRLSRNARTAATLYRENLEVRRTLYGNRPLEIADNLSALAIALRSLGGYEEAASLHQESLAIRRELTPDDVQLQLHLFAAAAIHRLLGEFQAARALYEEARESLLRHYPPGRNFYTKIESALADLHFEMGDLEEAEQRYTLAAEMIAELDRPMDLQAAWTDVNHSLVLRRLGREEQARAALARAMPIYEELLRDARESYTPGQRALINTLVTYGQLEALAGHPERAQALVREAVAQCSPMDSWWEANNHGVLGEILQASDQLEEAEGLLLSSYERLLADRGAQHLSTARAIHRLITLYESWDRPTEAESWRALLPAVFCSPVFRSPATI